MAYDKDLAERIRSLLSTRPRVTEKGMFGGLAFLVGGNMAVAASGQGGLLVRVDPAESDVLVSSGATQPAPPAGQARDGGSPAFPAQLCSRCRDEERRDPKAQLANTCSAG